MRVFAISDLHLSGACDKPMDIFGGNWENYQEKIIENWKKNVSDDDIVLIAGDISWAMKLEDAIVDLEWIDKLPGKKIIIKGNHEYWWKSISSVREVLPKSLMAIQNDSIKIGNYIFCGTRGWVVPEKNKELLEEDQKIYNREVERLKLSLMTAKRLKEENDEIIALIHFPPRNTDKEDSEFSKLFEEYGVTKVVFGHLHGYTNCELISEKNGVTYYFSSCDHINNNPIIIAE